MLSLSEKTTEEAERRSGNETYFGGGVCVWGRGGSRSTWELARDAYLVFSDSLGERRRRRAGADAERGRPDAGVLGAGAHFSLECLVGRGGALCETEKRLPN